MKKVLIYVIVVLVIGSILVYFLNETGLLAALLGGGLVIGKKLQEEMSNLQAERKQIQENIEKIREKRNNLEMEDLSLEEEAKYWKKQK